MTAKDGGKITVWGEGGEERDLLYISDLVDFFKLAISKQGGRFALVNVGCGSSYSIDELVRKIIVLSGKKLSVEYDRTKPSIKTKIRLDSGQAKELFGWTPKTGLETGIKDTISWYKKYHKVK
jgi:UDP-glucuronate decarboxylase